MATLDHPSPVGTVTHDMSNLAGFVDTFRRCVQFDVVLEHVPPGTGPPPTYTQATIPRCRNILDRGRGLHLLVEPHEVEPILTALPDGLLLRTFVGTEEEADELLKEASTRGTRRAGRQNGTAPPCRYPFPPVYGMI